MKFDQKTNISTITAIVPSSLTNPVRITHIVSLSSKLDHSACAVVVSSASAAAVRSLFICLLRNEVARHGTSICGSNAGRRVEGAVRADRGSLDQQTVVTGLVSTLLAPQGGEHAGWRRRGVKR